MRKAHETVMPRPAGLAPDQDKWKGAYSDIQAMVYYDVPGKSADAEGGWAVRDDADPSFEAYKEAALDPWFNQIHTLTWGPYTGGGPANPGHARPRRRRPPTQADPPVTVKPSGRNGYWMLGSDGKVYAFGQAKHLGAPTLPAGVSAADLETTPTGNGYWIVDTRRQRLRLRRRRLLRRRPGRPAGRRRDGDQPLVDPVGQGLLDLHQQGPGRPLRRRHLLR